MSRQYNMYNVQLSEFWKQRVGRENVHNAPIPLGADGEPEDDAMSTYSDIRAPSEISRVSTVTQQKINELEAKLDEEKRRAPPALRARHAARGSRPLANGTSPIPRCRCAFCVAERQCRIRHHGQAPQSASCGGTALGS